MYSIIQKISEKHNKILKEGLVKVLKGDDVSSLTSAIANFTNEMGKDLFTEIVKQIDKLVFEELKRQVEFESVRFGERKYITKNGQTNFERRYYEDKETIENIFIMGDGASYIKEGLSWIPNSVFVLDLFHLEK